MKVAICDDNRNDLENIASHCRRYDPAMVLDLFHSASQLRSAFQTDFYDLVLLDIEMPSPNGYEVGVELSKLTPSPIIIFTTQTVDYAVRGYGIALRYLPKPISYEMLAPVLRLAEEQITPRKIIVTNNGKDTLVPISDILYFEVFHHQITFHLKTNEKLHMRGSLTDIMDQLEQSWFVQSHKSYCVNLDYVDKIGAQEVTMVNGDHIPIGRSKRDTFRLQLQSYLRSCR